MAHLTLSENFNFGWPSEGIINMKLIIFRIQNLRSQGIKRFRMKISNPFPYLAFH